MGRVAPGAPGRHPHTHARRPARSAILVSSGDAGGSDRGRRRDRPQLRVGRRGVGGRHAGHRGGVVLQLLWVLWRARGFGLLAAIFKNRYMRVLHVLL